MVENLQRPARKTPPQSGVMPTPRKAAVLVLGMHRSGTSALTRVLNLLGCDLPKTLMGPNKGNEVGHWESQAICELNDRILRSAGTTWHDWQAFNPNWSKSPRADEFHDQTLEKLTDEFGTSRLFVLKDPRICRLSSFWLAALESFEATPFVVTPLRNPLEVAASLAKRDGFDPSVGHLLWLRHVLDAERATRGRPRAFVSYDGLMSGWRGTVERIQAQVGLMLPRLAEASASEIEAFLSEQLRHERVTPASVADNPGLSSWLRESFAILDGWTRHGEKAADFATLDRIGAAFDAAAPAFARPVEIGRQAVSAKRRLEQDLAAARGQSAERDARLAQLEREASAKTKDLAEISARLAQTESALAQRRHEADQRTTELAEAKQELQRLAAWRADAEKLVAGYKDHIALLLASERERQAADAGNRRQIAEQERALDALRQEAATLKAALKSAEDHKKKAADEAQKLASDKQIVEKQLKERFDEIATLSLLVKDNESELTAFRQQTATLRAALENAEKAAGQFEKLKAESAAETQRLKADGAAELQKLKAQSAVEIQKHKAQAAAEAQKLVSEKGAVESRLKERFDEIATLTRLLKDREDEARAVRRSIAAMLEADRAAAVPLLGRSRWLEGIWVKRQATALTRAGLFDPAWYLEKYPDVKKAGVDPAEHYVRHGAKEGRLPRGAAAKQ